MMIKKLYFSVALAAFILLAAAFLRYAQGLEMIAPDSARRTMQVIIGLILAAYANVMPKDIGPWRASPRGAGRAQSALRVGGWSLTLAGVAYAVLWALTPIAFADSASMAVVASATLVTMAYGAWTLLTCPSRAS